MHHSAPFLSTCVHTHVGMSSSNAFTELSQVVTLGSCSDCMCRHAKKQPARMAQGASVTEFDLEPEMQHIVLLLTKLSSCSKVSMNDTVCSTNLVTRNARVMLAIEKASCCIKAKRRALGNKATAKLRQYVLYVLCVA